MINIPLNMRLSIAGKVLFGDTDQIIKVCCDVLSTVMTVEKIVAERKKNGRVRKSGKKSVRSTRKTKGGKNASI